MVKNTYKCHDTYRMNNVMMHIVALCQLMPTMPPPIIPQVAVAYLQ